MCWRTKGEWRGPGEEAGSGGEGGEAGEGAGVGGEGREAGKGAGGGPGEGGEAGRGGDGAQGRGCGPPGRGASAVPNMERNPIQSLPHHTAIHPHAHCISTVYIHAQCVAHCYIQPTATTVLQCLKVTLFTLNFCSYIEFSHH